MTGADYIAEMEHMIRVHRRLDLILVGFFGLNVFLAANAILSMEPGLFQTVGVALNVFASVYGWDVIKRSERTRANMIAMLEQVKKLRTLVGP